MDFDLTDEQRQLADSVGKLLADDYSFDKRKGYLKQAGGSAALWQSYADLGLLGLPFDEADGGFGGGPTELMLVMEALGRSLVIEPYLPTVVLGGTAIRVAGSAEQRKRILPKLVEGGLKLAFAHGEAEARYDLSDVTTTARPSGSGWVIDGAKSVVQGGSVADLLIVSARMSGARDDPDGISLFIIAADAKGVSRKSYRLRDGTDAADIVLSGVEVPAGDLLGKPGEGFTVVQRVTEAGIAAVAAEAVGAMEVIQAMTLDYLKTRKQFGRAIGQFQALQHRAADMLIALEQGRSMAMLATMAPGIADKVERARNLAMAKAGIGRAARFVSQNAIQLHGGIGMTDEYAVGHYFRRLMVIEHCFGDTDHHLATVADAVA